LTEVRLVGETVAAQLRGTERQQGADEAMMRTAAFALGWRGTRAETSADGQPLLSFRPVTP
jgi:hypothetical protein